jgi:hypothetical protein
MWVELLGDSDPLGYIEHFDAGVEVTSPQVLQGFRRRALDTFEAYEVADHWMDMDV